MRISITLKVKTPYAPNVAKIVAVDNIRVPDGMDIKVESRESEVIVEVVMDIKHPSDILTLKNTADDILQQINVIEKTLGKVS
ncbi:KEOPS complex subunit Pcc1 [Stygiolobus caldivivus]|uniref:KEOPS complex Pcc1-like subunit n=1 Tax=Stygiolobus caldivivus TaxID=2824673 RepID=A0A8D5U5L0_9CREN|nr:KEOPS complex subunit Pcc1 [Stygiolobus caldivivus]BCU69473.1 hypothetical protein KN1_07700 [Stygiolobus caldivivus]